MIWRRRGRRPVRAGQRLGLVGDPGVQAGGVVLGEHRQSGNTHLRRRSGDADGDFAAIGDKQLFQLVSSPAPGPLSGLRRRPVA
jgi:hypothetical protein